MAARRESPSGLVPRETDHATSCTYSRRPAGFVFGVAADLAVPIAFVRTVIVLVAAVATANRKG